MGSGDFLNTIFSHSLKGEVDTERVHVVIMKQMGSQ